MPIGLLPQMLQQLNEDARMLTAAAKLWEAWHLDTWKGSQTYQETDTSVDFHGR